MVNSSISTSINNSINKYLLINNLIDWIKTNYQITLPYLFVIGIRLFDLYHLDILSYAGKITIFLWLILEVNNPKQLFLFIFPGLFLMDQAPQSLGLNELYFALTCGIIFCHYFYKHKLEIFMQLSRKELIFFGALILMLGFNLLKVINNGEISLQEWLRGVLPFSFILLYFPFLDIYLKNKDINQKVNISLFLLLFLFSARVIFYYFFYHLYENLWYYYDGHEFINIPFDAVNLYDESALFFFKQRITTLLPESTNPIVPLGTIIGLILYCWHYKKLIQFGGGILSITSIIAITLTATRSMFLTVTLSVLFLIIMSFFYYRSIIAKLLRITILLSITSIVTIVSCDMGDVYFNRFLQLYCYICDSIEPAAYQCTTKNQKISFERDVNITSRLVEYQIAFDIFKYSPIIGAGFGVKHEMSFDRGFGYILKEKVAYVHNFFFYMLMCSGIFGLLLYSIILLYPGFYLFFSHKQDLVSIYIMASTVFLTFYGAIFAVFRLISFNVLLALFWMVVYLHFQQNKDQK